MVLGTVAATPVALEAHAIVPTVSIAAVLVGAAAGSLLPDTDSPHSTLGKRGIRVPFVKHRGATHSLLALGVVVAATVAVPSLVWQLVALGAALGLGVAIGYLLHLFFDWRCPRWVVYFTGGRRARGFSLALLLAGRCKLVIWHGSVPWLWPRPARRLRIA
jgi:membrane-bound metal-dependent hydrolase YbcI (DUF457 family)